MVPIILLQIQTWPAWQPFPSHTVSQSFTFLDFIFHRLTLLVYHLNLQTDIQTLKRKNASSRSHSLYNRSGSTLPTRRLIPVHPQTVSKPRRNITFPVLSNWVKWPWLGKKFELYQMDFHVSNKVTASVVRLRGNEVGNASHIMTGRGLQGGDLSH